MSRTRALALTALLTLSGASTAHADPITPDRNPAASDSRAWAVDRPSRSIAPLRTAATSRHPAFQACVAQRESHGNPRAVNRSSGAAGIYQFLPAWRHGLPYMVKDRLVRSGLPKGKAREVRVYLSARPIERWPALYQHVGFAEVMDRGGSRHWALAGSSCERLRP